MIGRWLPNIDEIECEISCVAFSCGAISCGKISTFPAFSAISDISTISAISGGFPSTFDDDDFSASEPHILPFKSALRLEHNFPTSFAPISVRSSAIFPTPFSVPNSVCFSTSYSAPLSVHSPAILPAIFSTSIPTVISAYSYTPNRTTIPTAISTSSSTPVSALFPAYTESIPISASFSASASFSTDSTSFPAFSAVLPVSASTVLPAIPRTKSTVGFSTHHCECKHLQASCVAAPPVEPAYPALFIDSHFINCLKMLGALRQRTHYTSTAYKKKKDKIRPLDQVTDGAGTGGDPDYLIKCEAKEQYQRGGQFDKWLTPKFSDIVRGTRLTTERLTEMDVGTDLWPKEIQLLKELLYNREAAIAFTWQEKGRVRTEIEPPHTIRIRPGHTPWQERPMQIPRALKVVFDKLVTKMQISGILEPSKGPY